MHSEVGVGSRFAIELVLPEVCAEAEEFTPTKAAATTAGGLPADAAKVAEAKLGSPLPVSAPLHGRVLLVEDNPVNQVVAEAMLAALGLTVDVANDGQEALLLTAVQGFDIVLMDCQMPVLDGYEATKRLRRREAEGGERVPVIALTANALEEDRRQCMAAGMDDYLSKPYSQAQLDAVLRRWLLRAPGGAAG